MNILIISYAFKPSKQVGALRCSYWHENLGRKGWDVTTITAEQEAKDAGVHVVPVVGSSLLGILIKDQGLVWKKNIKEYIENTEISRPDCVIISGGPFMHFALASFFQRKFQAKVILDYRDPFSNNPAFNNSRLKKGIKAWFEGRFNKAADALVTVNPYCSKLLVGFDQKPNAIVQNGFDETVIADPKPVALEKPIFSYTGKIYFDISPFLAAITKTGTEFYYAGSSELPETWASERHVKSVGFVSYPEAVALIAQSDVGVIQTSGEDYISTTKIFDYIRCGRPILIVSDRYLERGSIHNELRNYPNVFWSKNTTEAIVKAIEKIQKHTYIAVEQSLANKYSRKAQMADLTALIQKITS